MARISLPPSPTSSYELINNAPKSIHTNGVSRTLRRGGPYALGVCIFGDYWSTHVPLALFLHNLISISQALVWDWLMSIPDEYKMLSRGGISRSKVVYVCSR